MAYGGVVLVSVVIGIVSMMLLYYYYVRIAGSCCLSLKPRGNRYGATPSRPPRWSSVLAARIEYIDDTALDIIRNALRELESKCIISLGLQLPIRGIGSPKLIGLNIKSFVRLLLRRGLPYTIGLYLRFLRLRRLYGRALRLYSTGRLDEYRSNAVRLLEEIEATGRLVEAYSS